MASTGSDEADGLKEYRIEEIPSAREWICCKHMTELAWVNEMEEDGSDTEEPDARVRRRVKEQKCVAAATFKCDFFL